MAAVIGDILGFAIGIAVSPVPIAAVILMLFASKARVTGPSFLIGWLIGITLVVTVVLFVPGLGGDTGEPSTTTGVIKGILGLLLLLPPYANGCPGRAQALRQRCPSGWQVSTPWEAVELSALLCY